MVGFRSLEIYSNKNKEGIMSIREIQGFYKRS